MFQVIFLNAINEKKNQEAHWKCMNSNIDMMCHKVYNDQDMNSIKLKCNFSWVL